MKILWVILALCFIVSAGSALTMPTVPALSGVSSQDLQPVASFEGGQRYVAGPYNVIVLSGSYREMGRQYGSLMKDELLAEYTFLTNNFTQRGYTTEQIHAIGGELTAFQPKRIR